MALIETITDASGATTFVNGVARLAVTTTGVTVSGTFSGGGAGGGYATGVRQVAYSTLGTVTSSSATIPFDNTIPQITEGFEILTCSITPQSSTSTLYVYAVVQASSSYASASSFALALFRDSTANALGVSFATVALSNISVAVPLLVQTASGSTSATTFRLRGGVNVPSTYINGTSPAGQYFGGAAATSLMVMEVGA